MSELKSYSVVATSETDNYINGEINLAFEAYDADEVDAVIATLRGANEEKTERIVELQKQGDELDGVKKSAELILMNLLDCGLIKEWYFNGMFNVVLKADDPHLEIAELKAKIIKSKELADGIRCDIEKVKADATETLALLEERNRQVEELTENERRLKRALWIAREWRAWCEGQFWLVLDNRKPRDIYHLTCTSRIHRTPNEWMTYWYKVERLCKKKTEEYK